MRRLAATAVASLVCYWLALADGAKRAPPSSGEDAPARARVMPLPESFEQVAGAIKPAVVSIRTVQYLDSPAQAQARSRPRRWVEGIGSGVLVDPRGYILTNDHVIREADRIEITLAGSDGRRYPGRLVRGDPKLDLALMRISSPRPLPYARLGDSSRVRVGDWAIAIGNPFGLAQTVTVGVISAVRQSFKVESHVYSDFFQTDAAINRGNSGGPLLNARGEIIGINTAIYGPTGVFAGIGFAIPSNQAKALLESLIPAERAFVRQ